MLSVVSNRYCSMSEKGRLALAKGEQNSEVPGGLGLGTTHTRGSVARKTLTRTTKISHRAVGTVRGNRCGPAVGLYHDVYGVLKGALSRLF